MNLYQFEQITRKIPKKYDLKIPYNDLECLYMFVIESNLLKTYRKEPIYTDHDLYEAILIALHTIQGYLRRQPVGDALARFETKKNKALAHAILTAIDPFTNEEMRIAYAFMSDPLLADHDTLDAFFDRPVQCLLRMTDVIDTWTAKYGNSGYFVMLEEFNGPSVDHDDKMAYVARAPMFNPDNPAFQEE